MFTVARLLRPVVKEIPLTNNFSKKRVIEKLNPIVHKCLPNYYNCLFRVGNVICQKCKSDITKII